jgi:phosphoglycerol transferase MdoB-like AlkP superfamily enzyme
LYTLKENCLQITSNYNIKTHETLSIFAKILDLINLLMRFKIKRNIYFALFLKIIILVFIFTFTRILFYFFNTGYFSNITFKEIMLIFLGGLRFDISAIFILNIPFIFLQSIPFYFRNSLIFRLISKLYFLIINSIAILANCVDFIYFRFTLKRTTADFFSLFKMGEDMKNIIPQIIKDFWYVVIIWIALVLLLIYLYKWANYYENKKQFTLKYYIRSSVVFIIISFLTVIGARGGFQLKPIDIITASQYASSNNIPLVLNTPFTIAKTIGNNNLEKVIYFKDETEIKKIFDPYHHVSYEKGIINKLNIVIIILESFSKEHIEALNKQQSNIKESFTPFLDSLIHESLVFPNAFANGRKSIEGIPAVVASIPTLMNNPFISSAYAGNKFYSLPNILKAEGYNTSFYHGGTNGTMGFDYFCKAAGFENYYGRYEYNNDKDYDGKWGILDEPFLQYFATSLNITPQPFFTTLFTLSSHHPYFVPEKYKNKFTKGNQFQKSISYADYSLKRFFQSASKMKWFDNTLFVITADHTSQIYNPEYDNKLGAYEIPILYYRHYEQRTTNYELKGFDSTITQQIDIMPSVLNYINYNKPYIAFGNSVFNKNLRSTINEYPSTNFTISYLNNIYQFVTNDYVFEFNGKDFISLYNRKKDPKMKNNLLLNKKIPNLSKEGNAELEYNKKLIKAIIQTYNQKMIDNKLTSD